MKVLLLNQCFYPDVAATSRYLSELAVELVERGHDVTVVASNRGYDDPTKRFARRETWQGIKIIRIGSLNLGKEKPWHRALTFATFLLNCTFRLILLPKFDAVLALTSPPLISFLGALFVQLKGGRLLAWVMDLNPDQAIVAGWLKESSLTAKVLESLLRFSLRTADRVIVLDRFMKDRILGKEIAAQKLVVLPPWALSDTIYYDEAGRLAFRARHGFSEKYLVMYAGNHSPCHPLQTILKVARQLSDRTDIMFCFAGTGSEQQKVRAFAAEHALSNIRCLPHQPLKEGILSAADLHLVVMGEGFAGIVHPCKIYNILAVGCPVLYIGPDESHVTDIAKTRDASGSIWISRHGEASAISQLILHGASVGPSIRTQPTHTLPQEFSREGVLPTMVNLLESVSISSEGAAPLSQPSI